MNSNRDEFPQNVRETIAERAGYICSNPLCNRLTIGPCEEIDEKSSKHGVASHICAASPKGPRYDINQTEDERKSIKNAIWLCGSCSILVDKNNGLDYPKEVLKEWKKKHEGIIKKYLEGAEKLRLKGNLNQEELTLVKHVVAFLEDRGALFVELLAENKECVILSIREIRTFLTQIKGNIKESGTSLEVLVSLMINDCRTFMNTTSVNSNCEDFINHLQILRNRLGVSLLKIVEQYEINIGEPLNMILPQNKL